MSNPDPLDPSHPDPLVPPSPPAPPAPWPVQPPPPVTRDGASRRLTDGPLGALGARLARAGLS